MSKSEYWKWQTLWTRIPASVQAQRGDETVALRIHPSRQPHESCAPADIYLTPQEAMSLAAWLSEAAEHLQAKQARRAARIAAREANK